MYLLSASLLPLWAWAWQPYGKPLHIVAAGLVVAGLAVFAYGRSLAGRRGPRGALLAMRLLAVAAITVLLLGPSRLPEQTSQPYRPRLSVLLDTSESMLTADCQGMCRIDFVRQRVLEESRLRDLAAEFDVQLLGFDVQLNPLPLAALSQPAPALAVGRATHLAESAASALARFPAGDDGGALLLLSDGRDSQDAPWQPAVAAALAKGVPVYATAVGGAHQQADVALLALPLQEYLLPNEPGVLLVKVYQTGLDQASVTVRLRNGDQEQSVQADFAGQSVLDVPFDIRHADGGQYEYLASVDPLPAERETGNNEQPVFCDVQDRRVRVLALEGQPFWDSKFLAQTLRQDDRLELTQITQLSAQKRETLVTRTGDTPPAVPQTVDEWAVYDVVILGQALENLLSPEAAAALRQFVAQRGGHVIFSRGMAYDPASPQGAQLAQALADLEPVVWGAGSQADLKLHLTPAGRASPWFSADKMGVEVEQAFSRLPGFQFLPEVSRVKPATLVLARAAPAGVAGEDGAPALVTMAAGRGTVAALLGDGLWQWSLLPPELQDLAGFYDAFWSNLVRWLAMGGDFPPGQQVSIQLSRSSVRLGDPLLVDVAYRKAPEEGALPTLEMTDATGERREIALSRLPGREPRFRATLEPPAAGVYSVALHAPGMTPARQERKFNVYHLNLERLDVSANPGPLKMLAEQTGGLYLEPSRCGELLDHISRRRASLIVPPRPEFIWDRWWVMTLLLAWCGLEWLLRRAAGMV